jgi:hypothetical protein
MLPQRIQQSGARIEIEVVILAIDTKAHGNRIARVEDLARLSALCFRIPREK